MGLRIAEVGLILSAILAPLFPMFWHKVALTHLGLGVSLVGIVWMPNVWTPMSGPLLLYAASVSLSATLARDPRVSWLPLERRGTGAITTLAFLASAWTVTQMPAGDRLWFLRGVVGLGVIESLLAVAQYRGQRWAFGVFGRTETPRIHGRGPRGTCSNSIYLGGLLALIVPVAVQWHWWPVAVLLAGGLLLTRCKAAILGFSASVPFMLVASVVDMTRVQESLGGRLRCCGFAVGRCVQRPLWGWGPNGMRLPDANINQNGGFYDTAESNLFQVMHDQGLLGLAALGLVWITAFSVQSVVTPSLVAYAVWLCFNVDHLNTSNVGWPLLGLTTIH